jgi:hypothetical protein
MVERIAEYIGIIELKRRPKFGVGEVWSCKKFFEDYHQVRIRGTRQTLSFCR